MVSMNKRIARRGWPVLAAGLLLAAGVLLVPVVRGSSSSHSAAPTASAAPAASRVPGQNYQICNEPSQYLTSPWTYHALASGSRSYTVSQYKALPGYGRTLPPLPSYIASESSATEAAVIYAPGSSVNQPAYDFPETPLLYFFEGGAYREISFQTVPATSSLAGPPPVTASQPSTMAVRQRESTPERHLRFLWRRQHPGVCGTDRGKDDHNQVAHQRLHWLADLRRWHDLPISNASGTTITLASGLTAAESAGTAVYANRQPRSLTYRQRLDRARHRWGSAQPPPRFSATPAW